jgi:malonyl-CoA/methylmalonyl-CoA synthetase
VAACEGGGFRILGRLSVDIIKTGGEKVSALEIEAVLRDHPDIADCAVVGLPDPEWGECVAAVVALRGQAALTLPALRDWARARLPGRNCRAGSSRSGALPERDGKVASRS